MYSHIIGGVPKEALASEAGLTQRKNPTDCGVPKESFRYSSLSRVSRAQAVGGNGTVGVTNLCGTDVACHPASFVLHEPIRREGNTS